MHFSRAEHLSAAHLNNTAVSFPPFVFLFTFNLGIPINAVTCADNFTADYMPGWRPEQWSRPTPTAPGAFPSSSSNIQSWSLDLNISANNTPTVQWAFGFFFFIEVSFFHTLVYFLKSFHSFQNVS